MTCVVIVVVTGRNQPSDLASRVPFAALLSFFVLAITVSFLSRFWSESLLFTYVTVKNRAGPQEAVETRESGVQDTPWGAISPPSLLTAEAAGGRAGIKRQQVCGIA